MARPRGTVGGLAALCLLSPLHALCAETNVHGLLDVVAAQRGPAFDCNTLVRGDSPYDAYGARMFVDGVVNPRLTARLQVVMRDASGLYVDGAYATFTPSPALDLNVEAGKIPWPIGTWGPRTYSNRNPLIGTPLLYQYHTTLPWAGLPGTVDELLANSGSGQFGVDYSGSGVQGMAIVDDSYWDVGVALTGSHRPLEYAVSVLAGAPGWGSTMEDDNSGKTVAGRMGYAPHPAVRVGVSGSYGPYLADWVRYRLPAGKTANDYAQKLAMVDAELALDHVELRAEGAYNVWQTSFAGDLRVRAGYVEGRYMLPIGAFLAARWDVMRFGDVTDSTRASKAWDSDVSRLEAGAGYRFTRDVQAKVTWQQTEIVTQRAIEWKRRLQLFAAQLSVSF